MLRGSGPFLHWAPYPRLVWKEPFGLGDELQKHMALINAEARRFTVDEYARMGEAGIFRPDERVELIEGEIVPMGPHNLPHADRITVLTKLFVRAFGDTHDIRVQLPLTVGDHSEPEPDFAILTAEQGRSGRRHPSTADLVIEIADSSLAFDRSEKASLYARAEIAEYWLINLVHGRLEVRTRPAPEPEGIFGWAYRELVILAPGQRVSPAFAPRVEFSVEELLG